MNCIILAAGIGKRFGSPIKVLEKVNNIPIIEYSINNALKIEPENIILVVNKDVEKMIKISDKIKIVRQDEPLGTMDAIRIALNEYPGFPFFLMLGDEILVNSRVKEMVNAFNIDLDGMVGYLEEYNPEEIKKTYGIRYNGALATSLIEKPKTVENNLKGTGYCIITQKLWKYMLDSRENNFVEAIDYSIKQGCKIGIFKVCDYYFNINTLEDLKNARNFIEGGTYVS